MADLRSSAAYPLMPDHQEPPMVIQVADGVKKILEEAHAEAVWKDWFVRTMSRPYRARMGTMRMRIDEL